MAIHHAHMAEGRRLTADDTYGILLGEGIAKSLQLGPGDSLSIVAHMAEGGMNTLDFEVTGIFRTFSKDFDARAVRIQLATAQDLLDTSALHSLVFLLNGVDVSEPFVEFLNNMLPEGQFEAKSVKKK